MLILLAGRVADSSCVVLCASPPLVTGSSPKNYQRDGAWADLYRDAADDAVYRPLA
jgi:hypothetical protein